MESLTVPIKHIILAEDDPDDRLIFEQAMTDIDYPIQVTYVFDGLELLSLLQSVLPDLLILDLDMPRKNGLECLAVIRRVPSLQCLPVIVASSGKQAVNIQTAYEMGAHLYVIKSPTLSEYVAALRAILKLDWRHPEAIKEQYWINGRYVAFN